VTNLTYYLVDFVKKADLGWVYAAPFDVVFSQTSVVEPDVVYVSKGHAEVLTEENIQGAPDLVVEVISPGTVDADRTFKLKLYARYGVQEYWIIDPEGPSAEIYRRSKRGLDLAAELGAGDSLSSSLFPGFSLPLQRLVE
jgi:Uma2 family endonuclease